MSIVLAYQGRSLNDIVKELQVRHPKIKRFRARNYGQAMEYVRQQIPSAILVDESIESGLRICQEIKTNSVLHQIYTVYFVRDIGNVDLSNTHVNKWYVRGNYSPSDILNRIPKLR